MNHQTRNMSKKQVDSSLATLWNLMVASAMMRSNNGQTHRILENMEKIISLGRKIEKISKLDFEIKHDLKQIWNHHRHLGWLEHQKVHPDFKRLKQVYDLKCDQIFSQSDWKTHLLDTLDLALKEYEEQKGEGRILKETHQELKTKIHHVCKEYNHFLPLYRFLTRPTTAAFLRGFLSFSTLLIIIYIAFQCIMMLL